MKKMTFLYILTFLIFSSCNKSFIYEIIKIEPSFIIEELNDSCFFKDIKYMCEFDNSLYISDEYNGRLLVIDNNMNLTNIIGRNGNGPGDFWGIGCVNIYNDTIFVVDAGNLRVNKFSIDGKYVGNSTISDYSTTINNFIVDNAGYFYFSSFIEDQPIVKYDNNLYKIKVFGHKAIEEHNIETKAANRFLLQYFQNDILTMQTDYPIINKYDKDGFFVGSYMLEQSLFKSRLFFKKQQITKDPENRKKTYNIFRSIAILHNKLFVLYIDHYNENIFCNKIAELEYKDDNFIINRVYQLSQSNDWFQSICFFNGKLFAFNGSKASFFIYDNDVFSK